VKVKKQDMTYSYQNIETFKGVIEYGPYSQKFWYGLGSEKNPIWKWIQYRIQKETPNQDIFDIYVLGGLLEEWITWDGDIFLFGPYAPDKIKETIHTIVKIGFEEHFYLDVTYQNKMWPIHKPNEWVRDEQYGVCEISNHFINKETGVTSNPDIYEYKDGLYQRVQILPYKKHWDNHLTGYTYKEPIKII